MSHDDHGEYGDHDDRDDDALVYSRYSITCCFELKQVCRSLLLIICFNFLRFKKNIQN